jgi:hypothetical protein
MPLGKAFGIMAVCMFGPCLPTEKALHADRLEIWKNAAKYCLKQCSRTAHHQPCSRKRC